MSHDRWEVSEPRTIPVDDVDSLKVMMMGGRIDVVGHDDPDARIEISRVDGQPVIIECIDGVLSVKHPDVRWDNFFEKFKTFRSKDAATISIALPRGTPVSVSTVSADGLIAGAAGKCGIHTVSGTLVADRIKGDLKANTVSGEMTIRDMAGNLNANTVSGEFTASGEITELKANTVDGDLTFDLYGPAGTARSNSVSGATTLRIPAESDVEFKANSAGGAVVLDGERCRSSVGSAVTRHATGDPRWTITANSASGDVTILRQEEN